MREMARRRASLSRVEELRDEGVSAGVRTEELLRVLNRRIRREGLDVSVWDPSEQPPDYVIN